MTAQGQANRRAFWTLVRRHSKPVDLATFIPSPTALLRRVEQAKGLQAAAKRAN